jgi:hypothetical protein
MGIQLGYRGFKRLKHSMGISWLSKKMIWVCLKSESWGFTPPPDSLAMDQWRSAEKLVNH